jgi:hypothetical protein
MAAATQLICLKPHLLNPQEENANLKPHPNLPPVKLKPSHREDDRALLLRKRQAAQLPLQEAVEGLRDRNRSTCSLLAMQQQIITYD